MTEDTKYTLPEAQEMFAKSSFNGIWPVLDKEDRSELEDEEMLLRAFTSMYHWTQIGTQVQRQRGCWMISKAYQALGRGELALEWAQKCQDITEEYPQEMQDFDLAFAQESLARANALLGELEQAQTHYQSAVDLGREIADPEDREIFEGDLLGGEWYGLTTGN